MMPSNGLTDGPAQAGRQVRAGAVVALKEVGRVKRLTSQKTEPSTQGGLAMNNTGFSKRIEIAPILGWILSDDELAIRARSLLRWKIRYNSIHVEAEKGHVTLSGQVDSSSDRDAAEQIIRKLSGVAGLTNRITTLSPRGIAASVAPFVVDTPQARY